SNNIAYRKGYPPKTENGSLNAICTHEDGLKKRKDWGLNPPEYQPETTATGRLPPVWKKARK
ncbi:Hypothetical predicted protein, partial [Pelobates cultripes]